MSGDIKLDGDWVIIDGSWMRVRTLDLMLDAPSRRSNEAGWRRALVHDTNDGLTINYSSDYPGGVTIRGKVRVDNIEGQTLIAQDVKAAIFETGSAKVGQFTLASSSLQGLHLGDNVTNTYIKGQQVRVEHNLTVDGEAKFREKIGVRDVVISPEISPENENDPDYQPYSLFDRMRDLRRTIKDLEKRVARLEGQ